MFYDIACWFFIIINYDPFYTTYFPVHHPDMYKAVVKISNMYELSDVDGNKCWTWLNITFLREHIWESLTWPPYEDVKRWKGYETEEYICFNKQLLKYLEVKASTDSYFRKFYFNDIVVEINELNQINDIIQQLSQYKGRIFVFEVRKDLNELRKLLSYQNYYSMSYCPVPLEALKLID